MNERRVPPPKAVWVVTKHDWDYSLAVGVYGSKELAEAAAKLFHDEEVREYPGDNPHGYNVEGPFEIDAPLRNTAPAWGGPGAAHGYETRSEPHE